MGGILEIGYGTGESIPFWKSLFPACHLYVLDRDVELEGDGFSMIRCDQSSPRQLRRARRFLKEKNIGVILDDGSHIPEHQLGAFNALFPLLRGGGSCVIEDIEVSYWRRSACYGYPTRYGVDCPASIVQKFSQSLPHWLNREFLGASDRKKLYRSLVKRQGFRPRALRSVAALGFGANCICITKMQAGDEHYVNREYRYASKLTIDLPDS